MHLAPAPSFVALLMHLHCRYREHILLNTFYIALAPSFFALLIHVQ